MRCRCANLKLLIDIIKQKKERKMKTVITKQELKELDACSNGYKAFVKANGDEATLSQAFESNGWDDIWWYISVAYDKFGEQQKNELSLLGCDWAERCLENFEKEFPEDKRPRLAIQAKRDLIAGLIAEDDLDAAWSAAWSARSAARSAAWSAAESARSARSAAESAAESAAWSARSARSARSAARSAAESAAWSARSAAESAAWSARSAAMEIMTNDLMQLFLKWESAK